MHDKYCTTCTQYERSGKEPPDNDCQKDWDGLSSSMETDLILQGFKQVDEYGLRYTKFIGDSSVFPTLVAQVPVWGHAIEKIECANHAIKCYWSALENLVKDKPHYKGKGKLIEAMHKKLTKAARCAIKMRSKEENRSMAIKKLQEDIHNGPLHCLLACSPDYCKTAKSKLMSNENVTGSSADTCTSPAAQSTTTPTNVLPADDSPAVDLDIDGITDIVEREITFWEDATNDDDEAEETPAPLSTVDQHNNVL